MRTARSIEVDVIGVERPARRHRSRQERREIAEESLQPGASVAVIARAHGVNANQVFHWRKLLREGRLDVNQPAAQLMPVHITEPPADKPGATHQQAGVIQIELGRVRIRIEGSVDRENLRTILEHLGR